MNKKGKINNSVISTAVLALVLLVVLFQMYASLMPTAQSAGDGLGDSSVCESAGGYYNASGDITDIQCYVDADSNVSFGNTAAENGIPFAGLFSGSGVVFLIIMAALVILIVKNLMGTSK